VVPPRRHVVLAVFAAAVVVGRSVKVRVAVGAMPLVVGACGIRLEVAGGRGCTWRGAQVGIHGGSSAAGTEWAPNVWWVRLKGGCVKSDYRCGGNRRVLMVAITRANEGVTGRT